MSSERKLVRRAGLTVFGPAEHQGESKYSWIVPIRTALSASETLLVRSCRIKGHELNPRYDPFSPIISLRFDDQGLVLRIHGSKIVPGHQCPNGKILNIYTNQLHSTSPCFRLPFDMLCGTDYLVHTNTDYRGNLLSLLTTHDRDTFPKQMVILNVDALLMMEGLSELSIYGEGFYHGERVGQAVIRDRMLLPVFANITNFMVTGNVFAFEKRFAEASYHRVQQLLQKGIVVNRFSTIDQVMSDCGGVSNNKSVTEMRKAFVSFFSL